MVLMMSLGISKMVPAHHTVLELVLSRFAYTHSSATHLKSFWNKKTAHFVSGAGN